MAMLYVTQAICFAGKRSSMHDIVGLDCVSFVPNTWDHTHAYLRYGLSCFSIICSFQWTKIILNILCLTGLFLLQSTDLIQCPINQGHFVSPKSSEEHMKFCTLAAKGYSKEEVVSKKSFWDCLCGPANLQLWVKLVNGADCEVSCLVIDFLLCCWLDMLTCADVCYWNHWWCKHSCCKALPLEMAHF